MRGTPQTPYSPTYRGFTADIFYSLEDKDFYGYVITPTGTIGIKGKNRYEIEEDFHRTVDNYQVNHPVQS